MIQIKNNIFRIFLIIFGISFFIFNEININKTNAYSSDEIINLYGSDFDIFTNIYTVPSGKDFIVKKINISSDTIHINSSNDGVNTINSLVGALEYNTNIIIKDNYYIKQDPGTNGIYYSFVGILVDEGVNIENIVNDSDNGFNKNIFTKDGLVEMYLYEFVVLYIIYMVIFFEKIIGRKNNFLRK